MKEDAGGARPELTMRLSGGHDAVDAASRFAATVVGHCDSECRQATTLVVSELAENMVKYGRGGEPEISIALDWDASALTFCIRDFGAERFDPTLAPDVDTTRPIAERRAGGLGIHLVRRMADRLTYGYDRGNVIRVTKRLAV